MAHSRTIVISFGRFNPPTTGHQSLIKFIEQTAHRFGADIRVYPSQSQDPKKNPLPFAEKIRFLRTLFPHINFNDNTKIRTPFDAIHDVVAAGYTNLIVVVGSDRVDAFTGFSKYIESPKSPKYRKDIHIPLESYHVVPVPVVRGGGGVAGMSASKQRAFALAGDYESFKQGVPGQNDRIARQIYNAVRRHMQIKEAARLRATVSSNTLRLPINERTNHDGEWHIKCPKCNKEWYNDSKRGAGGKCPKCGNTSNLKYTGSETVYEANDTFTVMAIENNKVVWQIHSIEKREIVDAAKVARKNHPHATVSVENKGGKIVKVYKPGQNITEARLGMPLKGHPYHKKSDEELHHIIKDAGAAARAMRGHNETAENKYLDQVNDASSVLYYRRQGGKRITEATSLREGSETGMAATQLAELADQATQLREKMLELGDFDIPAWAQDHISVACAKLDSVYGYFQYGGLNEDHLKVGDRVHAGMGHAGGAGFRGIVDRIEGDWVYVYVGKEKFGDRIIKAPHKLVIKEADTTVTKPASEVDRLKVRQKQDEIALKQRQANELMAAKLRDVQQKAREQQNKATAPKPASR